MRVGVLLAAVASCSVWATDNAPRPLAPVETAHFKPVPARTPAPAPIEGRRAPTPATAAPPPVVAGEREAVLAMFAHDPAAPTPPQKPPPKSAPARSTAAAAARPSPTPAAPLAAPEPTAPQVAKAAPLKPATPAAAEPAMSGDASGALARVLQTRDNGSAPFIIIDKRFARLWLFDPLGQPRGNSAVLLGLARGDDTAPGIGDKPLAQIKVGERTTPAGRFIAEPGRNARGDDIFWVDYDAAVSLHRVHDVNAGEHRLQRLLTPSVADNRISYGCINVPTEFYDRTLLPLVGGSRPVVYLLPETRPMETIFQPTPDVVAKRAAPVNGKGASWRPPRSTVSGSSNPSTML